MATITQIERAAWYWAWKFIPQGKQKNNKHRARFVELLTQKLQPIAETCTSIGDDPDSTEILRSTCAEFLIDDGTFFRIIRTTSFIDGGVVVFRGDQSERDYEVIYELDHSPFNQLRPPEVPSQMELLMFFRRENSYFSQRDLMVIDNVLRFNTFILLKNGSLPTLQHWHHTLQNLVPPDLCEEINNIGLADHLICSQPKLAFAHVWKGYELLVEAALDVLKTEQQKL